MDRSLAILTLEVFATTPKSSACVTPADAGEERAEQVPEAWWELVSLEEVATGRRLRALRRAVRSDGEPDAPSKDTLGEYEDG